MANHGSEQPEIMICEKIERGANDNAARLEMNLAQLGHSVIAASEATRVLSLSFYNMAERAYEANYKRLPGSNKTKRLRKKRRDMVYKWLLNDVASWAVQGNILPEKEGGKHE